MATAAPAKPKLTAAQARKIAEAENLVAKLRAQLEQAETEAKEIRARYDDRITEPSDDPRDAGKNVRIARAGGWEIRVSTFTGGDTFSLKTYLSKGHKITPAMKQALTPGAERKRWTVKRLAGPYKPGSVEPA